METGASKWQGSSNFANYSSNFQAIIQQRLLMHVVRLTNNLLDNYFTNITLLNKNGAIILLRFLFKLKFNSLNKPTSPALLPT